MTWLDGPGFVAWLEEVAGEDFCRYRPGFQHRVLKWRKGGLAEIYTADKHLMEIGLHLSQVPDHLYRKKREPTKKPVWQMEICAACRGPVYDCKDRRHKRRKHVKVTPVGKL